MNPNRETRGRAIRARASSRSRPPRGRGARAALIALLQDVVDDGASVGFLPPLSAAEAGEYSGRRLRCCGPGRAAPSGSPGRRARADRTARCSSTSRSAPTAITGRELIKLMVQTRARRRGLARALMLAAEAEARRLGRSTLFLDTRLGDLVRDPVPLARLGIRRLDPALCPQCDRRPRRQRDLLPPARRPVSRPPRGAR